MIKNIGISQTLKINELCKKLVGDNREIYNYGFGQSPFKPPHFFQDMIIKNMNKNGYLPVQGLSELRYSIVNHYKNFHNVNINENNIIIGPGTKELLCLLNLSIDEDIYFIAPYWVSYVNQLLIFNKKFKVTNTTFEQKWKITPEQIMDHTDNSFLLINFPNNPTGLTYSKKELQDIVNVCKEKNITIISDEIYQYLNFNNQHNTLLELYPENTIVSNGLSKWCHSGGYRLGYLIFPDKLSELKQKVISCASETFSCVNTPLQYGAISIFNNFNKMIEYNQDNIKCLMMYNDFFYKKFIELNIKVHKGEGAFYMYLDFGYYSDKLKNNNIMTDTGFCTQLLDDTGIALLPGNAFGINEGYTARFAITNFSYNSDNSEVSAENIKGMDALSGWLNNL